MAAAIFAFFAGVMLLQTLAALPPAAALFSALTAGLLPWCRRRPWLRMLPAFCGGFLWAWLHATLALAGAGTVQDYHGRDLQVAGRVVGLPERSGRRLRFELQPELLLDQGKPVDLRGRLRLNWYGSRQPLPQPGQALWLRVRLKPPRGFMNPGGFDYEGWLYHNGIVATGYVKASLSRAQRQQLRARYPQLLSAGATVAMRVQAWRQGIGAYLQRQLSASDGAAGILRALAIGDRSGIDAARWQVLRATGTSHLVAISGLHVGLVAGFCYLLLSLVWRASARLCAWLPAARAGALGAVAGALVYSALAGFAIPTQRALLMVSLAMFMLWRQGHLPAMKVLALALFGVLLLDPAAVLSWGFWLSFAAVLVIVYGSAGRPLVAGRHWWQGLGVHFRIAIGLAPLLLLGFNQFSLVSPLANILAVPWVSLVTVPVLLSGLGLAALAPLIGSWPAQVLLAVAAWSAQLLNRLLDSLAATPFSEWWSHTPGPLVSLAAGIGVLWLLAPRGWPARWLGLPLLLGLVLILPVSPGQGEFELTLLDVGQGLAAAVRTRNHVLVYDTGPRFSESFDTGQAVVVPWLRHHGYRHLDLLVISHGDRDHAGGFASVRRAMAPRRILWGARPPARRRGIHPCHGGSGWVWDGVRFSILSPFDHEDWLQRNGDNNGSCVIKITSAAGHSVLLSGDIEASAEARLLARHDAATLAAEVLVAPHHGSTTSSSAPFVAAVAPGLVLYSTGYLNRFGFPRPVVWRRYRQLGAGQWQTALAGAISIHFGANGPGPVRGWRQTGQRYWHQAADLGRRPAQW